MVADQGRASVCSMNHEADARGREKKVTVPTDLSESDLAGVAVPRLFVDSLAESAEKAKAAAGIDRLRHVWEASPEGKAAVAASRVELLPVKPWKDPRKLRRPTVASSRRPQPGDRHYEAWKAWRRPTAVQVLALDETVLWDLRRDGHPSKLVPDRGCARGCPDYYVYVTEHGETRYGPCKRATCKVCGPKQRAALRRRIEHGTRAQSVAAFECTLTLPGKLPHAPFSKELMLLLAYCWSLLLKRSRERNLERGQDPVFFFRAVEHQARGAPHYHLLVFGDLFPGCKSEADRSALLVSCGFGPVHTYAAVRDKRKLGNYLTKYVTKSCERELPRHCNRYSYSRSFMPSVREWVIMRRLVPEATANPTVAVFVQDGDGFKSVEFGSAWWTCTTWPPYKERRAEREADEGREAPEPVSFVCQHRPR